MVVKVFIGADIEGVAGIDATDEATKGEPAYAAFRAQMDAEIAAASSGALAAGATEVDLLRYKRRTWRAPMSEEPTGDTPRITEQDFTHQEELVSRIWQHVYGLRAELIAAGRLGADPAYASQAEDHRQASLRERAAVDQLVREYVQMYGEEFVRHGEAEFRVERLVRLEKK